MNFDNMIKRLEQIVEKLEGGECTFDEATTLFEEGREIVVACFNKLESSKGKITELVKELDNLVEKDMC